MKTTDAKLAELEALEKAATKGEWVSRDKRVEIRWVAFAGECLANPRFHSDEDAAFIAALRNSASDLIADLREANATIEFSQCVNQAYADGENAAVARAEKAEAERDAWKCEADGNRAKLESIMALRSQLTEAKRQIEGLKSQVKNEKAYGTQRKKEKVAQWDALVAERDRLREALREVEKHVQIASCECLDLPKFSCCTCGAYEHAEALALVDRVLGIGVEP